MFKIFLSIFLSMLSIVGFAGDGSCKKLASSYADVIASAKYTEEKIEPTPPFKVISADESTEVYFKEFGYDKKKIAEIKKYDPVKIYAVSLESSDQWQCVYYVTLSITPDNKCSFKTVSQHHCAK